MLVLQLQGMQRWPHAATRCGWAALSFLTPTRRVPRACSPFTPFGFAAKKYSNDVEGLRDAIKNGDAPSVRKVRWSTHAASGVLSWSGVSHVA